MNIANQNSVGYSVCLSYFLSVEVKNSCLHYGHYIDFKVKPRLNISPLLFHALCGPESVYKRNRNELKNTSSNPC